MPNEALHGTIGHYVRVTAPLTEADPWATLVHLLAMGGNMIGGDPYVRIGPDRHPPRLFAAVVGDTARGRKGSSASMARYLLRRLDPDWNAARIMSGFGSGESIIAAVRDPTRDDPGSSDRRACVLEPEFARVLRVAARQGSTMSAIFRSAFDGDQLQSRTKDNVMTATNAHVSIIAHVTRAELAAEFTQSDTLNGFANRFLWVAAKRGPLLPHGGDTDQLDAYTDGCVQVLGDVLQHARQTGSVALDDDARALWEAAYTALADDLPGTAGAVTARAEPISLRVALIYALLDGARVIRREHLAAALAVVDHGLQTAVDLFGTSSSDADQVLRRLRAAVGYTLSTTAISRSFSGHWPTEKLQAALDVLEEAGEAYPTTVSTGGRPATHWTASQNGRVVGIPNLLDLIRKKEATT